MENTIIITFCILLLIAYFFDLTSSKTKVPSVILLLLLGLIVKQITIALNIVIPDLTLALPVLGTIGLILIVLEGSLELDLCKSKIKLIGNSFLAAFIPILFLGLTLAFAFKYMGNLDFKKSLINVIPLCVISSAIAIPSAKNLSSNLKEFVIYESSLSDILGVLIFNFLLNNEVIGFMSFLGFVVQILVMIIISYIATMGLSYLLHRIDHHVKFVPIAILIILIYSISKFFHLPALLFILFFGLLIGNIDLFSKTTFISFFHPEELSKEVKKFRDLIVEGTFIIRSLFFLLFGYMLDTKELFNPFTLPFSLSIVFLIYLFRSIQLKFLKIPLKPLLFIAPRGLITILLFLSIGPTITIPFVNKSLISQVIILTAMVMMFGLMTHKQNVEYNPSEPEEKCT